MDLGSENVQVKDINLRVNHLSFDTVVFRLHIRSIENGIPDEELLTENIYVPIFLNKGWQKIDLKKYNILLSGKVALSVEWIRISSVIKNQLIKMRGDKRPRPQVLFNVNRKNGTMFYRWGSEAPWEIKQNYSPVFYMTIKE